MALERIDGIEEMKAAVGRTIGPGEWQPVSQDEIDQFGVLSGDGQWIHTDVERAKTESPFGTTVAHGNLTLSKIDGIRLALIEATGFALAVNYGYDRVRFPAPVPAGARIRGSVVIDSVEDVGGGWWQLRSVFTVEVEGAEKPACVAEALGRFYVG